jgi:hypothetical protein
LEHNQITLVASFLTSPRSRRNMVIGDHKTGLLRGGFEFLEWLAIARVAHD